MAYDADNNNYNTRRIQWQITLDRIGDFAVSAASLSSSSRSCCRRSCSSFHALSDPVRTVDNNVVDGMGSGLSGGVFCALCNRYNKLLIEPN